MITALAAVVALLGPAATTLLAAAPATTPEQACPDAGQVCESVFEATDNETVARLSDAWVATPARILVILLIAFVALRLVKRAIARFSRGLGEASAEASGPGAGSLLRTTPLASARAAQRAETLGALLSSVATFVVWTIAALMVFGELGLELGPLIAGAGIAGIALGFGAQNLVRDFLSGIFMLLEDQYGVGDIIDAGPASGVVEGVSLRTTRLRDVEGNVWHIPNGTIERVSNMSQQWSRALLDIEVSYGTDTDEASLIIKRVADETMRDPDWAKDFLEEPEVWGVQTLGSSGVAIRLVVKVRPLSQFKVGRELRRRIKKAFDAEGVEIPFPQQVVWHRGSGAPPATPGGPPGGDRSEQDEAARAGRASGAPEEG